MGFRGIAAALLLVTSGLGAGPALAAGKAPLSPAEAGVPQITSTDYPDDTPIDPADWHGGVGRTGTFTFTPGAGETDVTGYRYALDDPLTATAATQVDGSTPVQITPLHAWLNTLYVYPVHRAGNVGPEYASYGFYVKEASTSGAPVGHWSFDEGSGGTAADSAGGHPVTWAGGVTWGAGRIGASARLDGANGYGETTGPVVHTDRSLTVSAWVRLTGTAHDATVAAQAGGVNSGFQLAYSKSADRWTFGKPLDDTGTTDVARAVSDQPPVLDAWTHLVGVYDVGAPGGKKQLRLYVNGIARSTAPMLTSSWDATGPLEIGRAKANGAFQDHFEGDVDDVRVYAGALTDQQVLDLSMGTPPTSGG